MNAMTSAHEADLPDVLAGVEDAVPAVLARAVRDVRLIDHHVHGAFTRDLDGAGDAGGGCGAERARFDAALLEASTQPVPAHRSAFDTPLGLVLRRWCAPLLGLAPHAPAQEYWEARSALGAGELAQRFTAAAGVQRWVVDTGYAGDDVQSPAQLAASSGGTASEVVRLEPLVEGVLRDAAAGAFPVADVPAEVRSRLRAATAVPGAVAVKSIAAYRCGFAIDWSRPADRDVTAAAASAAGAGAGAGAASGAVRLVDPVLIAFAVHEAVELGVPVQLHVGLGDSDVDLRTSDPTLLLPLIRHVDARGVPVLLLHCYPFHRQAAYLAAAFESVSFDVGLAVNQLGSRSVELVGEALELAPFTAQLYSSDAFGLPELHLLGSVLWRRAMAVNLGAWVRRGECSEADAVRVVELVGVQNARRVYSLP